MQYIYNFVISKTIEKTALIIYDSALTISERKILKNGYTMVTDPVWRNESLRFMFGSKATFLTTKEDAVVMETTEQESDRVNT